MLAAAALACGEAEKPAPAAPPGGTAQAPPAAPAETKPPTTSAGDAVERGRVVYMSICTACHNADPKLDGSVGPANAGASRALVEAKVLRGEYPPGYTPKRPSNVMPPLPHLTGSIDDLTAFLAASAK